MNINTNFLDHALDHAARGLAVFPCDPATKAPRTDRGFKDASTDQSQLRRWWTAWPDSAIGMPSGTVTGLFVVDLDGAEGLAEWVVLCQASAPDGQPPQTYMVNTPRGGRHVYFSIGQDWTHGNTVKKLAGNIDTRGNGGYVIRPPSQNGNGRGYQVHCDVQPAPAPQWFVALLDTLKKPAAVPRPSANTAPAMTGQGYGSKALADECAQVAAAMPGERNHLLNRSAFKLSQLAAGGSLDRGQVEEALMDAALAAGLPPSEARATIRSGMIGGAGAPRAPAPRAADTATSSVDLSDPDVPAGPDADSTALQAAYFKILASESSAETKMYAMATATMDTLLKRGRFYYHDLFRDRATAMYFDGRRKTLELVASDYFSAWLAQFTGLNRTNKKYNFIFSAIEDAALVGKTAGIIPETYFTTRNGAIYISNGAASIVKITAAGPSIVDNGTDGVLFQRGRTLLPWKLTETIDPFESCRLWRDMRVVAGHGKLLFKLWVLSVLTGQRCKPPLVIAAPVGSGKTRAMVGVFELLGMPQRIAKIEDNGEPNFWTSVDQGGLFVADNADTRNRWLADALAAAATDGSQEKRRLYTDADSVTLKSRSWVAVTSANPTFASDAGLADRLLVVRLDRRDADETAESALTDEVVAIRDGGLSWMANIIGLALADTAPVPPGLNRRHPDFAAWAVRLGRAMGCEAEAVAALQAAEADKSLFNLENCEVGAALLAFMRDQAEFTGTAADLVEALATFDSSFDRAFWTAKRVGKQVGKLWPHLQSTLKARQIPGRNSLAYHFRGISGICEGTFGKTPLGRVTAGTLPEIASTNAANAATPQKWEIDL